MRRRDFTMGLLLASAVGTVRAQEPAKQHRIAIVIASGPVTRLNDPASHAWQAFLAELRRLGDIEGQNLTVERYSGEGRPKGYADLARQVVSRNPDLIVPISPPIMQAVSEATGTIPIVGSGAYTNLGLVPSLAHPSGNITGVTVTGYEIYGKRLQILKEAVPSVSKVAVLDMHTGADREQRREALREPSQLIVELVDKSRLPAIYPWRDYVEVGGLMAHESDLGELRRRMADDVHEILNGAKPGDIPIYQSTKFALVINLKAAKALGLTLPPAILAGADELIE